MRTVKIVALLIGSCAVVIGMWASSRSACANSSANDSIVKWQYAQLYVGDNRIVWMEASKELTITPPTDPVPDSGLHTGPNTGRYCVDSKATRNNTVGVLDLFGSDGWEVVSNTPSGTGTVILLKRPH